MLLPCVSSLEFTGLAQVGSTLSIHIDSGDQLEIEGPTGTYVIALETPQIVPFRFTSAGIYRFSIYANRSLLTERTLSVQAAQPSLLSDKKVYLVGESIRILLKDFPKSTNVHVSFPSGKSEDFFTNDKILFKAKEVGKYTATAYNQTIQFSVQENRPHIQIISSAQGEINESTLVHWRKELSVLSDGLGEITVPDTAASIHIPESKG
jgi:hypothetical protein